MKKGFGSRFRKTGVSLLSIFLLSWSCTGWAKSRITFENERVQAVVLEGSWYQIGKDAATLSHINRQQFLPEVVQSTFDSLLLGYLKIPWLANSLKSRFLSRLANQILPDEKNLIWGVADGLGLQKEDLQKSFVIPELQNFMALEYRKLLGFMGGPFFACTSFVAKDPHGGRIFGRNLDFPAVGILDNKISVYLIKPESGFKMLTVSTRGLPTPGITGLNEKGLALALHVVFSKYVDQKRGVPVLSVNREVLQYASSVDEALNIYKKYTYESGWIVHLTGKDRSVIVELDGRGAHVFQYENEVSVLNNAFISDQGHDAELRFMPGSEIYNMDRLKRLKTLLGMKPIKDVGEAIEILNDSSSPYNGGAVADFSTSAIRGADEVSTTVLLPDELSLWVSDGAAPSSFGNFYRFNVNDFGEGRAPQVRKPTLKPNPAAREYALAQASMVQSSDQQGAYIHLLRAKRLSSDCSFDLFLGDFALVLGHFDEAAKALHTATNCAILNPHEKAIAWYLDGLLSAINRDGPAALESLQRAKELETAVPRVLKIPNDASLLGAILKLKRNVQGGRYPISSGDVTIDLKYGDRTFGWN